MIHATVPEGFNRLEIIGMSQQAGQLDSITSRPSQFLTHSLSVQVMA
jgi:hypothetical protein